MNIVHKDARVRAQRIAAPDYDEIDPIFEVNPPSLDYPGDRNHPVLPRQAWACTHARRPVWVGIQEFVECLWGKVSEDFFRRIPLRKTLLKVTPDCVDNLLSPSVANTNIHDHLIVVLCC